MNQVPQNEPTKMMATGIESAKDTNEMAGEDSPDRLLILGIGNILMGDEGVGVRAVERLHEEPFPDGVDLLDGGTGSFYLLEAMQNAGVVILMDATIDGKAVGSITRLTPRYSSDFPRSLTAHDIGLKDLIDTFYLTGKAPRVILYTVTIPPLKGDLTMELSQPVASCLPELCRLVREEVLSLLSRPTLESVEP